MGLSVCQALYNCFPCAEKKALIVSLRLQKQPHADAGMPSSLSALYLQVLRFQCNPSSLRHDELAVKSQDLSC